MAVMTNKKLVETCIKLANEPTVYYSVSGGDWCKWNGSKWNMDCVCMIKGILWGFNFDKSAPHGGAIYGSNGVYDDTADGIIKRCTSTSKDFSNIKLGEIVHMSGHVGIYIGNGKVVESTAAWEYKTQISDIGTDGKRSRNGSNNGYWLEHGKLSYVEYLPQEYDYEEIEEKEIILNKDTALWNLSFTDWNNAKAIENYAKGDRFIVVATYKHSLGGKYYIVKSDYEKKNHYGFNTVDCDDYVEPVVEPIEAPSEEEKEEKINNTPKQETASKTKENGLLWFLDLLVNIIKKIFKR